MSGRPTSGTDTQVSFSADDRAALQEAADALASALHDHNIGRDIRGWVGVSEAFGLVKDILTATDPEWTTA